MENLCAHIEDIDVDNRICTAPIQNIICHHIFNITMYQVFVFVQVAQQHNAAGSYGIETHLSYCKAEKIGSFVSPSIYGVPCNTTYLPVYQRKLLLNYFMSHDLKQDEVFFKFGLQIHGTLLAIALGTSPETQTLVETFNWQWTVTKSLDILTEAAMYVMRDAWVSVILWSFIRFVVVRIKLRIIPQIVFKQIRNIDMYCSCRSIIVAFMLSTFVATYTRCKWYLKNRNNIVDNAFGMAKSSFWESEDMQSLVIAHCWALLFSVVGALSMWTFLLRFLKVIERHRLYSGFDIPQLILSFNVMTIGDHCVLILPLSGIYLIYASINVLCVASMPSLPDPKLGKAIQF
ncbi:hypothetical protein THRCLA_01606 [Thraustotheca clavata]|uniref:Transmembrane protein n=1 Tax=Thraustotheca clavata TaxID=74557 RepID=A0A1W0A8L5_9STRA|nr:hypothetical protein THRCLA_01606 [Thraustotheca clavata]